MAVFQPPPTWAPVVLVDPKSKNATFNPVWLKWFVDLVQVINASGGGGGTVTHNLLSGLQGGAANQYYHLSLAQYSLVPGSVTAHGILIGGSPLVSTAAMTDGQLLVGQSAADPLPKTITGDVSIAASGAATIGSTGAWTPADGSGAGLAFSAVSANYTKIGNMVFAYSTFTYPVTVSGAAASISGLPFAVANANYAQVPAICSTTVTISGGLVLVPNKNASTAKFDVGSPFGVVTNAQLSTGTISSLLAYPVA